jgi:pimeloyl-ACP methyl ester carboxylesterase
MNKMDPVIETAIEYEKNLRSTRAAQNPIIVIPGILGSNIVDSRTGDPIWGDFGKRFANPKSDKNLRLIALPMQQGQTLDQLQGLSKSAGSLRYVKGTIANMPIRINTYASMLSAMGVGSEGMGNSLKRLDDYIDDQRHQASAFEFDYDWRRSIDENAVRLGNYLQQVTRFVQLQRGNYNPVKFDIVAHSMGGLIARYYLQYGSQLLPAGNVLPVCNWSGSAQVERVVCIGTPNAGSLFALENLVAGIQKNPIIPRYDPLVLGTLPAVYQLLPRVRHKTFVVADAASNHADFLSTGFWLDFNWGLADKSRDRFLGRLLPGIDTASARRDTALDHLEKCLTSTRKLHYALDNLSKRPAHLQMFLFVGDSKETPLVATAKKGEKKLTYLKKGAGDGTVSRASVLFDERLSGKVGQRVVSPLQWDGVYFFSSSHLGLSKDPLCIKNILYILLERPDVLH